MKRIAFLIILLAVLGSAQTRRRLIGNNTEPGRLAIGDIDNSQEIEVQACGIMTASFDFSLPCAQGTTGQFLQLTDDTTGQVGWVNAVGGGYTTLEDNAVPLTARSILNFRNGFTLTDDGVGGKTIADVAVDSTLLSDAASVRLNLASANDWTAPQDMRFAGNVLPTLLSTDNQAVQLRLNTDGGKRIVAGNATGTVAAQILMSESGRFRFTGTLSGTEQRMEIKSSGEILLYGPMTFNTGNLYDVGTASTPAHIGHFGTSVKSPVFEISDSTLTAHWDWEYVDANTVELRDPNDDQVLNIINNLLTTQNQLTFDGHIDANLSIESATGFIVNTLAGIDSLCAAGQYLSSADIDGGIAVGGSCASIGYQTIENSGLPVTSQNVLNFDDSFLVTNDVVGAETDLAFNYARANTWTGINTHSNDIRMTGAGNDIDGQSSADLLAFVVGEIVTLNVGYTGSATGTLTLRETAGNTATFTPTTTALQLDEDLLPSTVGLGLGSDASPWSMWADVLEIDVSLIPDADLGASIGSSTQRISNSWLNKISMGSTLPGVLEADSSGIRFKGGNTGDGFLMDAAGGIKLSGNASGFGDLKTNGSDIILESASNFIAASGSVFQINTGSEATFLAGSIFAIPTKGTDIACSSDANALGHGMLVQTTAKELQICISSTAYKVALVTPL